MGGGSGDAPAGARLRCLFVVQGEGRGHMTQALAMRGLLASAGHEVVSVLMGRSARREVPGFFTRKIGAPVTCFDSPNFVCDGRDRAVRLWPTVVRNLRRAGAFRRSLRTIEAAVRAACPDVVVNFFEPMAGVYYRLRRPAPPMVCVGHQYMFHHPAYPFPPGRRLERWAARWFTDLTAPAPARRLALSFYPAPDLPAARLGVVPPLLRPEVFVQPTDRREPFFLVYLLNRGYADEILRWHEAHPDVVLHCFWDDAEHSDPYRYDATLTFHRLDDERFLAMMARCSGLVTTAGFESVSEAMYLGRPVLMVPVEGHFEQQCNARDAAAAGAGLHAARFEIDRLIAYLPAYRSPAPAFGRWTSRAGDRFVAEIEAAARGARTPHPA